ncbi:MAG: hypothetical protein ACRDRO_19705 [Pseudonocardiaceae bacterium]
MSLSLRGKGINHDTGFSPAGHTGGDPGRLSVAGERAAATGLEVWFAPFPCDLSTAQLLPYFAQCADTSRTTSPSRQPNSAAAPIAAPPTGPPAAG